MTTATQPSVPIRRQLIRALIKPGNTLPAFVWLFLVFNQAVNSGYPPSPSTIGLVVINSTALVLFMIRRDASKVGTPIEGLLAISGTFVESFLKDAGQLRDAQLLPTLVQAVALWFSAGRVAHAHNHNHDHDRAHDHHHDHEQEPPSDIALRVKALESLLVEKGILTRDEIDAKMADLEERWT